MKRTLPEMRYHRLSALYRKLKTRFDKAIKENRFKDFTRRRQRQIINRLEKLRNRLSSLEQVLKLSGAAMLTGVALTCAQAQTSVVPVGSEFQVNTYTTYAQQKPSIAIDSDGDFVVTWTDYMQSDNGDIYAQRYDAAGVPQGGEFLVNTYTTYIQKNPSIAMDSDGNFVIVWESRGQDGNDSGSGIYAQRYDASGNPVSGEFQVNTYTTNDQSNPSVAMDSDGDFVIVWESYYQENGDYYGVYAQRYDASGTPQGSEFHVNTYVNDYQISPSVAMDDDGDFVVVWESKGQDGNHNGIYAQRYDALGIPQGSEFSVNTYTTGSQYNPSIAMDKDGDFVIAWQSYGQDGSGLGIYAQRYDASGAPQGSEFQVNTYTTSFQINPSIAMDSDGDFVIAWTSYDQDGDYGGIYARRYDASGTSQDGEFLVNTSTNGSQNRPFVTMHAGGNFVVVWESGPLLGGEKDIYAQRYELSTATGTSDALVNAVKVYPNPSSGMLQIDYSETLDYKISTIQGMILSEGRINAGIDLSGLEKGVYLLHLKSSQGEVVKKIVKR